MNKSRLRSKKTVDNQTIKYYYNGSDVINETKNGTNFATNVMGVDGPISRQYSGYEHYFYKNIHGDVIFAFTSNHWRSSEYSYDAYGNGKISYDYFSTNPNPIRYSGQYYDTESGMTYLRARYYDPYQRRFISVDPHWNVNNMIYGDKEQEYLNDLVPSIEAIIQSANLYAYCVNNPISYVDSNGESVTAAIVAAIATCVIDGVITGGVYAFNGRSFGAGFVNGFVSCLGTELGIAVGAATGTPMGEYAGIVIGNAIGSATGSVIEDLIYSNKSSEEIAKSAAKSASIGIISGVGSSYFKYAIDIANEAGSAAQVLMEYDESFGRILQILFDEVSTILSNQ